MQAAQEFVCWTQSKSTILNGLNTTRTQTLPIPIWCLNKSWCLAELVSYTFHLLIFENTALLTRAAPQGFSLTRTDGLEYIYTSQSEERRHPTSIPTSSSTSCWLNYSCQVLYQHVWISHISVIQSDFSITDHFQTFIFMLFSKYLHEMTCNNCTVRNNCCKYERYLE